MWGSTIFFSYSSCDLMFLLQKKQWNIFFKHLIGGVPPADGDRRLHWNYPAYAHGIQHVRWCNPWQLECERCWATRAESWKVGWSFSCVFRCEKIHQCVAQWNGASCNWLVANHQDHTIDWQQIRLDPGWGWLRSLQFTPNIPIIFDDEWQLMTIHDNII